MCLGHCSAASHNQQKGRQFWMARTARCQHQQLSGRRQGISTAMGTLAASWSDVVCWAVQLVSAACAGRLLPR